MEKIDKVIGKISKVDKTGWGFILSEEHKFTKFFFHWTGLIQGTKKFPELEAGMKVKFVPLMNNPNPEKDRGPRAIQIEVIESETNSKDESNEKTTLDTETGK